mmetsp:Transcript_1434/g.2902  ORF Transcript_1434/g.2902 Transcript_1434/m.2902 type:complete len:241 (-) Transcript_1434:189-911(-)
MHAVGEVEGGEHPHDGAARAAGITEDRLLGLPVDRAHASVPLAVEHASAILADVQMAAMRADVNVHQHKRLGVVVVQLLLDNRIDGVRNGDVSKRGARVRSTTGGKEELWLRLSPLGQGGKATCDRAVVVTERAGLADTISAHSVRARGEDRGNGEVGSTLHDVRDLEILIIVAMVGPVEGKQELVPDQLQALREGKPIGNNFLKVNVIRFVLHPELGIVLPHFLHAISGDRWVELEDLG